LRAGILGWRVTATIECVIAACRPRSDREN
jgi:hypothetical protein